MKFVKLLIVSIAILSLSACATTSTKVPDQGLADPCAKSLIVKNLSSPDMYITLFGFGTTTLVSKFPKTKVYFVNTFFTLDKLLLDDKVTYLEVSTLLKDNITWIGAYFNDNSVLNVVLNICFDRPIPINSCDLEFLKKLSKAELNTLGVK